MKTQSIPRYSYCFLLCLQALTQGAEIPKLFNNTALNLGGAWDGGVVPGAGDVMLWNNLFTDHLTAGSLSAIGGDLTVQGLKVTNVGGTANPSNRYVGFTNASSANTLTLGSAGIDMSAATQVFLAQSKVTIGANQTWNIGNANTQTNGAGFNNNEDLAFHSQVAAAPFNFGGFTVTTTGNGYITASSGYTFSNGTLDVGNNLTVLQGGSSRVTTLNSDFNLVVTSGRLRLQANSGAGGVSLTSASPATVHAGILELRTNTAGLSLTQSGNITLNSGSGLSYLLDTSGASTTSGTISAAGDSTWRVTGGGAPTNGALVSGAISGAGNINYLNTATGSSAYCRLTGDNSGYTGAISLNSTSGNGSLRLGSATSGSAAATWNVASLNTLQVDGVAVQLGNLNGAGTVTNSHASNPAALTIGGGNFTGAVTDGGTSTTSVTKTGPGILLLTGANTYTGLTTVSGGTLVASNDQTGGGAVTVADGATFGMLQKAADTTLTTGDLTIGSATGGTLQVDMGSQANPFFAPLAVANLLFNGTSSVRVAGKNLVAGTFPLVQYTTLDAGSTAVNALDLILPTRTNGSLADTGTGINVTITDTQQVKWDGDVSDNWDIDPDGSGASGTLNWLTTVSNDDTRYIQGPGGTDIVTFDDSATGSGTVNLTTTLAPIGLTVNNPAKPYTFTGSGKISGFTGIEKSGAGSLTIANTTANDYTGGTVITAGTLRLGDGLTPGAGVIPGAIDNSGTLVVNRPDDHDFANTLTGTGTLEKAQSSTLSFPLATTLDGPLVLTGGKVRFVSGGFLNGAISGGGELEAAGGTLDITGNDPNTNTGMTTVSAGALRLGKTAGVNAVGGDITLTGTAAINTLADEQIPDTATLHVLGSNADTFSGAPGVETFANAVVNGSVATTQLILRNNATVTNTATINQGILGVASGNTTNLNAVVMTSPTAILRMAGNTAPSVMNVGSGGITASAGSVEVKFNTSDQDAILNLAGDVATTGAFAFVNGGYGGASLNVIRLNGTRTFTIGDATTTTVAPDFGDFIDSELNVVPGALVKAGTGTLVLNASCSAAHTGGTTVAAGTLQVDGAISGAVQVNAAGTLGGTGSLSGAATVDGSVAPGASAGQLNSTSSVTLAPGSGYDFEVASWTGVTAGTDWDLLAVDSLVLAATPADKLTIRVLGTPAGFTETDKTMVLATSVQPITGFDAAAIAIDATGFSGAGTWEVQSTGTTLQLVYTAAAGTPYDDWAAGQGLDETNDGTGDDPDQDGHTNLVEFALNSTALSGAASGQVVGKVATAGGESALTITLPVRGGATFSGTTEQVSDPVDGVIYRIQAGNNLGTWDLAVSEVTGADATAIQTGLPVLDAGWTYRTFRSPGPVSGDPKEFLRVVIDSTP